MSFTFSLPLNNWAHYILPSLHDPYIPPIFPHTFPTAVACQGASPLDNLLLEIPKDTESKVARSASLDRPRYSQVFSTGAAFV